MDYALFLKKRFAPGLSWAREREWDIFISAYNRSERVNAIFDAVQAARKWWIVHSEYRFGPQEYPAHDSVFTSADVSEAGFINEFVEKLPTNFRNASLCVDITGFMRPHIMFLMHSLAKRGVRRVDVLYTEPRQYVAREKTTFTEGAVIDVRLVNGFAGLHRPTTSTTDIVIVGAGYEHDLIVQVAHRKSNARKLLLLGFPPLQPDFYQENALRAAGAVDAEAANTDDVYFAPASDPFVTAGVLSEIVGTERTRRGVKNVYLCPLSTRPQALGFALYYMYECINQAVSVIYPFTAAYSRDTSIGVSHSWIYSVELPQL